VRSPKVLATCATFVISKFNMDRPLAAESDMERLRRDASQEDARKGSQKHSMPMFRRAADENLSADAGSIGHVADAASVSVGMFSSAARLRR
jgi:hypothetical protein